ncbi:MAG: HIT family protein [Candidatus Nanoarchaeia archaeon]|jgi:diadenosine tetraphosphate (Ap4A) HIT family hydrolase
MCKICDRVKEKNNCFYEDDNVIACVSPKQITYGKSSVYYKKHVTSFFDLSEKDRNNLMSSVMKVSSILKKKFNPDHFNFLLLGNYYHHLHWHLIPRYLDKTKDHFYFNNGLEPCHMGREIMGRYDISNVEVKKLVNKLK